MAKRRRNAGRKSTARTRAVSHSSGFSNTCYRVPEGIKYFSPSAGTYKLEIIPFKAKSSNPFAKEGDLHYERTWWMYRNIGSDQSRYCAPGKTFKKKDFIAEYAAKLRQDPNHDTDLVDSLRPQERQLFLILDHDDKEKGVQLWDVSHFAFGRLLDQRIESSDEEDEWEFFYYPDEGGSTLKVTFSEEAGAGYSWIKAAAIDFKERSKALPKEVLKQSVCLDDLLIEVPYEELKAIFLQTAIVDSTEDVEETVVGYPDEDLPGPPPKKEKQEQEESDESIEEAQADPVAASSQDLGETSGDDDDWDSW